MKFDTSPTSGPPFRRRRWIVPLAGVVALYLLLLMVAFLLLRALLPAERLKQALIATLESSLGRKISVGEVHVNPLSGIALQEVRIEIPAGADSFAFPVRRGSVARVRLHYRLLPLFKRRVEIDEISLHEPRVDLLFGARRQDRLVPQPPKPAQASPDSASSGTFRLPVALDLRRLGIHNAACTVTLVTDTSQMEFGLDGLSFVASGLRVPRGKQDPWHAVEGRAQLACHRAAAFFRQYLHGSEVIAVGGVLDFALNAEARTLTDVEAKLHIGVDQARLKMPGEKNPLAAALGKGKLPGIELRARATGDVVNGNYLLNDLAVVFGGQQLMALGGAAYNLGRRPRVEAELQEGEVALARLLNTLRPMLAGSDYEPLLPSWLSGTLSLGGTRLRGEIASDSTGLAIEAVARLQLRDCSVDFPSLAKVERLSFSVSGTANLDSSGLQQAWATTKLSFRRAAYFGAALPVGVGETTFDLEARAPAGPQLVHLDGHMQADSALGASLSGEIDLTAAQMPALWRGSVRVKLSEFPLDHVSKGQVLGQTSALFAATFRSLDDIGLEARVVTDSLRMRVSSGLQPLPSLELAATAKARAIPWSVFALDSLLVKVSDFASARLRGRFDLNKRHLSVFLQDLAVYHRTLPELLPASVQEELGELSLVGSTHLQLQGSARLMPGRPDFVARGQLTSALGGEMPSMGLALSGAHFAADIEASSDLSRASLSFHVDTMRFAALGTAPVTGTSAHFELLLPEVQRLVLSEGHVLVPTLATHAEVTGTMDFQPTGLRLELQANPVLEAADTVLLADALKFVGNVQVTASLRMDGPIVSLNGKVVIPDLSIFLPGGISFRDIKGVVPFAQAFDLATMRVTGSPAERYAFAGPAGRYPELFAPHFAQSLPEQGWLTVERMSFAGYGANNLRVTLFLGGGRLVVPSLLIDAYDGNFGGSIVVEFPTLSLADANYRIEGHLSGVNSALLAARRGQPAEKGLINANFSFAGKGLDVTKGIDVQGSFRITDIGPRVADNLLRSLDPQGLDAGIRSARFFINHGFKPRLISFDLRHGHLYPSIRLSQPWYFPVRIGGGRVELARIPLAFFLQMLKQETEPAY